MTETTTEANDGLGAAACSRPACCLTEEGLECSCCSWHGCEETAVKREDPIEGIMYDCPFCGEECAHTPLDETTDYAGPCVCGDRECGITACCALADAERCGATLIQSVRADNLARGDRRCTRRATTQSGLCHQHALYEAKHEWCFPCGTKRGEKCWGHCVGTSWHNDPI